MDTNELIKELKPMMTVIYDIFKDPETASAVAEMYWNLYCSLRQKGFTDDQALRIVENFNAKTGK